MKFRVQLKNPDTLSDAIADAVDAEVDAMGLPGDEAEAVKERRITKVGDACDEWFRYGEYVLLEIDTDAKTCTVLPAKDQT